MGDRIDPVDRLVAIEEIKQLKARYFRAMDTKDWGAFAAVFAPDALMDMSGEMRDSVTEGEGITRGNTAIAEFVQGAVQPVETVHHGHMAEIEILSPTTARGIWSMEDMLRWPVGSPIRSMHGYGHYHETYEKLDGRWCIKTIALTRLRVDTDMA
jgi:uncharacterized protein (TIGR02246 family)